MASEWLTALETRDELANYNLCGQDLIRLIAHDCVFRRITCTGFRQITIGSDNASGTERQIASGGHLWRYFLRAFYDGNNLFGDRSTVLEADWEQTEFAYRIERDAGDERPTTEVQCWISWANSAASYSTEGDIQEVWHSLSFDKLGVLALARRWRRNGNRTLATVEEIEVFVSDFQPRNSKEAWRAFRTEFGARAVSREAFASICSHVWGNPTRGRPKRKPNNSPQSISPGN